MQCDLTKISLFRGICPSEIPTLLSCLDAKERSYKKGDILFLEGTPTELAGIVLSGMILIELGDVWGNNSVLNKIGPGGIFAEAYACTPDEPLMVNVSAAEDTTVLFLNIRQALTACSAPPVSILIRNLLTLCAEKNLQLSRRILHTGSKSIRGRLLSYFSECIKKAGSYSFDIPYNRQQLADYLSVERSALCSELSKMQKSGILRYHKNHFEIHQTANI